MAASSPLLPQGRGPYAELTIPAVALGVVLGAIMTACFVYIALKLGFTLGGSTVAAIMGWVVLRKMLKRDSIVENNINQTIASGVNGASSGVAFTVPALFLLGIDNFDPLPFIVSASAGSFLGIILIIPLRKQMIEFERLRFPSGIAVASLLKSPGAGAKQAKLLLSGIAVGAFFTATGFYHVLPEVLDFGTPLGLPAYIPIAIGISFANFGAGLLAGRGGLPFVAGGILAWWVISPAAAAMGWVPDPGVAGQEGWQTGVIYSSMLRPMGIGMLIGGALMGVVLSFPAMRSAMKSLSAAVATRGAGGGGPQEMSPKLMSIGAGGGVLLLFCCALWAVDELSMIQALGTAIVGTIWLGLAGVVVAQATGMTDISPLSGMSLIAVTIFFFMTAGSYLASVLLGVAVCIGIGQCADMMQDLKSGHLIGSVPRRQQMGQFMVAWAGVPVAIGAVFLFWHEPGFGPGMDLSAPQGQALAAILEGLGAGDAPLDKYAAGATLGAALGLFPLGGVGVLVGLAMYLPFYITLGYGVGCVVSMALTRKYGRRWYASDLVPVAAGFIVGEALTSLVLVILRVSTGI